VERFTCEDDDRGGFPEMVIAYRTGKLRLYATDREKFACLIVDTSNEEVANMAALLNHAGFDPAVCGVMLTRDVYKALRKAKAPFCLERQGDSWFLRVYNGAMHPVRIDNDPRLADFCERILADEFDRCDTMQLMFKVDHAKSCMDAVYPSGEVQGMPAFEIPQDTRKPIIVRKDGNVGVFMPIYGTKADPVEQAIVLCTEAVAFDKDATGLARKILELFKVRVPAPVAAHCPSSENAAPGQ
jgi:hypothetical protein